MSPEELRELKLLRQLRKLDAKNGLCNFIDYTKEDYDAQWFHEEICAWLDKLESGEIKKLMIFLPPQHGKSEISSRRYPAYVLGRNPETKIALCSYNQSLASGFNRNIQSIIDEKSYAELFPETRLNSSKVPSHEKDGELRNTEIFEVVGSKGFVKTVGIGGPLTGTAVDLGIIDDPYKDRKEANSPTTRKAVWEWYIDVFCTRLHNNSKQLMLFTRWHEDDLAGRLLDPKNECYDEEEAKEWTVVAFSALKEDTKPIECAEDFDDPRKADDALWEAKHSKAKYVKRRRINPTSFNSIDQQRPYAAEGNKIKKEWWEYINENELPFDINSVNADFFIDGAFTKESQNDETGILSCYYHKGLDKLFIFNCSGVRKELYELLKYFPIYSKVNHRKRKSTIFIELKASGHPLKSMMSKPPYNYNCRAVDNKVVAYGKLNRVENAEPFIASGKVVLVKGSWNKAFVNQCASFPNGVHDDMLDVAMYAIDKYFLQEEVKKVKIN